MIPRSPYSVNRYDPPTSGFINLAPAFSLIRLLPYVLCYLYLGTASS
jgi:hypothetical protein